MKEKIIVVLVLFAILATLPFVSLFGKNDTLNKNHKKENITVYLSEKEKNVTVSWNDYLFGVIAGEISPEYPEEAIKVQAVCSKCFALYRMNNNDKSQINGADITDSPSSDQCYISKDEITEKWGEKQKEYSDKIYKAIEETKNVYVKFNGEIALTVFHSVSGGKTESSEIMWGSAIPYLSPVESVGDLLCNDYLTTKTFSSEEFVSVLNRKFKADLKMPENKNEIIKESETSESGTVTKINILGITTDGKCLREIFGLNSSVFDISIDETDDKKTTVTFTVRGKGHGVGLSQFGAKTMAEQGSTFDEILKWYYPGCTVEKS